MTELEQQFEKTIRDLDERIEQLRLKQVENEKKSRETDELLKNRESQLALVDSSLFSLVNNLIVVISAILAASITFVGSLQGRVNIDLLYASWWLFFITVVIGVVNQVSFFFLKDRADHVSGQLTFRRINDDVLSGIEKEDTRPRLRQELAFLEPLVRRLRFWGNLIFFTFFVSSMFVFFMSFASQSDEYCHSERERRIPPVFSRKHLRDSSLPFGMTVRCPQ